MAGDAHPARYPLCRLWSCQGRDGGMFLSGRLGGTRVLVVPNTNRKDDQDASHVLVFSELRQGEHNAKWGI